MNKLEKEEVNKMYDDFQEILNTSKEFGFETSYILKIRQYYGNKEVYIDLSKIDEETFSKLVVDKDKIYDEDLEDDYEI